MLSKKVYDKPFHTEGDNKYYLLQTGDTDYLATETVHGFSFEGSKDKVATTGLHLLRLSPVLLNLFGKFGNLKGEFKDLEGDNEFQEFEITDDLLNISEVREEIAKMYEGKETMIKFNQDFTDTNLALSGFDFLYREVRGNATDNYFVKQTKGGVLRIAVITTFTKNNHIVDLKMFNVNQMIILTMIRKLLNLDEKEN